MRRRGFHVPAPCRPAGGVRGAWSPVRLLAAAGASLALTAPVARAQLRIETELGGAVVSQASFPTRRAATVQGTAEYHHPEFRLDGGAAFTMPDHDPVRVHALVGGALRIPSTRRLGGELAVAASVYDDGVFPAARAGLLAARAHAPLPGATAWLQAAIGKLDDQFNQYPLAVGELGASAGWGALQLTASATYHQTQGEPRTELPDGGGGAVTVRDRIAYSDVAVAPRLTWRRLDVSGRAGVRVVHQTIAFEPRRRAGFGSVDAAWWVRPRSAIVMGMGRELPDLARGLPATGYLTLGLRARLEGRPRAVVPTPRPAVPGAAPDVLIERGAPDGAMLRVITGAEARQVEIAATFTAWEPVALTADGTGVWQLAVMLPSGPHRLVVRVDGGAWTPPANLPMLDDEELGGRVGIVTVP